jgi:hypothetical protein
VVVTVGGSPSSPGFIALLWASADNVAVSTAAGNQANPQIVADGSGGAIIVWADNRSGSDTDIYAQRVNSAGVPQWAADGVPVTTAAGVQFRPQITSDGSGGAIIAWMDNRNDPSHFDLYGQRLNGAGVSLWTPGGVPVSVEAGDQFNQHLVPDGSGGAIIVWEDSRNSATAGVDNIFAQRLNNAGSPQWALNGVAVSTAAGNQANPQIVADGSGGTIIVWEDSRNSASAGVHIFAQRLNSDGVPQWTGDSIAASSVGDQFHPQVTPDGSGGVIIAWEDYRRGVLGDIFAQRLDGSGTMQWGVGGDPVATALAVDEFNPQLVSDGSGGAIITWIDNRNDPSQYDLFAQRLDGSGVALWTLGGVAVSVGPGDPLDQRLIADGSGGAIAVWADERSGAVLHIFAQRVNRAGVPQWSTNGIAVSFAAISQFLPQLVSDGAGGAIIAWQDSRNNATTADDIYAQGIMADGTQ